MQLLLRIRHLVLHISHTSVAYCSSGIFMVSGIIDSFMYHVHCHRAIKKKIEIGKLSWMKIICLNWWTLKWTYCRFICLGSSLFGDISKMQKYWSCSVWSDKFSCHASKEVRQISISFWWIFKRVGCSFARLSLKTDFTISWDPIDSFLASQSDDKSVAGVWNTELKATGGH